MVFDSLRFLIDEKTVKKLVFVSGDVSEGSENDLRMRALIGDNWKMLTGADQPVLKSGSSPGFDHGVYWPLTMQRVKEIQRKSAGESYLNTVPNNTLFFAKIPFIIMCFFVLYFPCKLFV